MITNGASARYEKFKKEKIKKLRSLEKFRESQQAMIYRIQNKQK